MMSDQLIQEKQSHDYLNEQISVKDKVIAELEQVVEELTDRIEKDQETVKQTLTLDLYEGEVVEGNFPTPSSCFTAHEKGDRFNFETKEENPQPDLN